MNACAPKNQCERQFYAVYDTSVENGWWCARLVIPCIVLVINIYKMKTLIWVVACLLSLQD